MIFICQADKKLQDVVGGKTANLHCSHCHRETVFSECHVNETVKLYLVFSVRTLTEKVMQCQMCFSVCNYDDMSPQETVSVS